MKLNCFSCVQIVEYAEDGIVILGGINNCNFEEIEKDHFSNIYFWPSVPLDTQFMSQLNQMLPARYLNFFESKMKGVINPLSKMGIFVENSDTNPHKISFLYSNYHAISNIKSWIDEMQFCKFPSQNVVPSDIQDFILSAICTSEQNSVDKIRNIVVCNSYANVAFQDIYKKYCEVSTFLEGVYEKVKELNHEQTNNLLKNYAKVVKDACVTLKAKEAGGNNLGFASVFAAIDVKAVMNTLNTILQRHMQNAKE